MATGTTNTARTYWANFAQTRTTASALLNHKLNTRTYLRTGAYLHLINYNMLDSSYKRPLKAFRREMDYTGSAIQVQPYVQIKHYLTEKLVLNAGVHVLSYTLVGHTSAGIDPRFGLRYQTTERSAFSLAYGLHSQTQAVNTYFQLQTDAQTGELKPLNTNLGLTRSHHFVAGYDYSLGKGARLKFEAYYQWLFNVPVEQVASSISALNQGGDFKTQRTGILTNNGVARNMGVEATLERFFQGDYFVLFTTSVYDSRYQGSDGVWRNTQFNGQYVANLLGGKEWKLNSATRFGANFRLAYSGSRLYSPIDVAATQQAGEEKYVNDQAYSQQYPQFFRSDVRVMFRYNRKRVSHEFSLDIVNLTDQKNVLGQVYDFYRNRSQLEYQLGRLPLFNYIIDF